MIYRPKAFDNYCKLLGIKIRDFKKPIKKKKVKLVDDQLVIEDKPSKTKSRKTVEINI